jgi:hypothetical protein
MGCGCGKSLSSIRSLVPSKKISPTQLQSAKDKPLANRPVIISSSIDNLFKPYKSKINLDTYSVNKKTIIIITINGNAEGKYIKNIFAKFANINPIFKNTFDFVEVDKAYLVDKNINKFPLIIFKGKKSIFKKYIGLFDVKAALEEFLAYKE